MLIDLANHRPSFMPYKAGVLVLEFFERESEMASSSGTSRGRCISLEEAIRIIQPTKVTLEVCQVTKKGILIRSYTIWTRIGGKCFVEVR